MYFFAFIFIYKYHHLCLWASPLQTVWWLQIHTHG